MKKIFLTLSLALSVVAGPAIAAAADSSVTLYPDRDVFYPGESIQIILDLETPHEPLTVRGHILSSKGKKLTPSGFFADADGIYLEAMGSGVNTGFFIDELKPGTYRAVFETDDGRRFEGPKFKVAKTARVVKPKIDTFDVTFAPAPGAPYAARDFRLGVEIGTNVDLMTVRSTLELRCSPAMTLGNKEGSFDCGKRWKLFTDTRGRYMGEGWLLDREDLPKPVKFEARLRLYDEKGKVIDSATKRVKMSAEG